MSVSLDSGEKGPLSASMYRSGLPEELTRTVPSSLFIRKACCSLVCPYTYPMSKSPEKLRV